MKELESRVTLGRLQTLTGKEREIRITVADERSNQHWFEATISGEALMDLLLWNKHEVKGVAKVATACFPNLGRRRVTTDQQVMLPREALDGIHYWKSESHEKIAQLVEAEIAETHPGWCVGRYFGGKEDITRSEAGFLIKARLYRFED